MWRVLFYRLSQLHNQFFPNSTTQNTRYDPGVTSPVYLFPTDPPDYATVGIGPVPASTPILKDFRLHEVTRRALNCLTLLYIEPQGQPVARDPRRGAGAPGPPRCWQAAPVDLRPRQPRPRTTPIRSTR